MKKLNCLAATLGCLLFISSTHAQQDPANATAGTDPLDYGTLGHTSLTLGANLIEYRNASSAPTGYGSDFKANIEATDNFDLNLDYGINHARNCRWSTTNQVVTLGTTAFYKFSFLAPYLSVAGGYGWGRSRSDAGKTPHWAKFSSAVYDVGAGVEVPVFAQASVRIGIDREEYVRRPHPTEWTYKAAFDYNFDDTFGVDTGINYQDGRKGMHDAIVYHAGMRFTFD